jgi:hypothetical protein
MYNFHKICVTNLDSAVGIEAGYGLDDRRAWVKNILFSTASRPALGALPASCIMGNGGGWRVFPWE